jgi:hypothetical protein
MAVRNRLLAAAIVVAFPVAAQAQEGIAAGSVTGAVAGAVIAGPVGAVIGAMAGAAVGGTAEEAARQPRGRVTVRPAGTGTMEREDGAAPPLAWGCRAVACFSRVGT